MSRLNKFTDALRRKRDLSSDEVTVAIHELLEDGVSDEQKASFLSALASKGETIDEIAAFALELRKRTVDPEIEVNYQGGMLLDVCGTGADRSHTFNISSCVMFVVAAAGVPVVKHGNRAITSRCGSADVLEALGVRIDLPVSCARECLEAAGVTFFFAPLYHPAFKKIASVRKILKERGERTVFNILGPLLNPARPTHQIVGIFDPSLLSDYAEVMKILGVQRAAVVHGDGLDEFTTLGVNKVAILRDGRVEQVNLDFRDSDFELQTALLSDLEGGDSDDSARIIRDILRGTEKGPRREIVQLNAAVAFVVTQSVDDYLEGWKLAGDILDSGKGGDCLARFIEVSQNC